MIRVMIERHCPPGNEAQFKCFLIEMRTAALHQHGYISGETVRDADDHSLFVVISTWATLEAWKIWESSMPRLLIEEKIRSLTTTEKIHVGVLDYET